MSYLKGIPWILERISLLFSSSAEGITFERLAFNKPNDSL